MKTSSKLITLLLLLALNVNVYIYAGVPAAEVTLVPVNYDNRFPMYTLTGYNASEATATMPYKEVPLFAPYEYTTQRWWHNNIAEMMQARMPVILLSTRGHYYTNTTGTLALKGPGIYQPRRLTNLLEHLDQANIGPDLFKMTCFVDSPMLARVYGVAVLGLGENNNWSNNIDMADPAAWEEVFWKRTIQIWHDVIPQDRWYLIDGRPLIQLWNTSPSDRFINMNGNIKNMLNHVSTKFLARYGVRPYFMVRDKTVDSANQDMTADEATDFFGVSGWFSAADADEWAYKLRTEGNKVGNGVPGFIEYSYYTVGSSDYGDLDRVIFRKGLNNLGANGDTLKSVLDSAYADNVRVLSMEGWTDVAEDAGFYRSEHANWTTPNQYINMFAKYSDLRKETIRLEAEGCDSFYDTTTGNTGGKFRRTGNLDIKELPTHGWAVTSPATGEWIEHANYYLPAGTYKIAARYAYNGTDAQYSLAVNGTSLGTITAPTTGSSTTFDTVNLGTVTLAAGEHDFKFNFVNGKGDLDWLFIKRIDNQYTFKAKSNSKFVQGLLGGNSTINATATSENNFTSFLVADINGGALTHGDTVRIQHENGMYMSAQAGGNSGIVNNKIWGGNYETFTIEKITGTGAITMGTDIALKSYTGHYVQTIAADALDVKGTTKGTAQTFNIQTPGYVAPPTGSLYEAETATIVAGTVKTDVPAASAGSYVDCN